MSTPLRVQLDRDWIASPTPIESDALTEPSEFDHNFVIPDSRHLQTVLYPQQPFWGQDLRAINQTAWTYRRIFTIPEVAFRRARLQFDGVDYYASVWLNHQFLGQHEGNFAPFTFDVTQSIRRVGKNIVTVRVTAPWDTPNPGGTYPIDHVIRGLVKGTYEHGEGVIPPDVNPIGIWRPVWLILDQGISLDAVRIRASAEGIVELSILASNGTDSEWRGKLSLTISAENHDGQGLSASLAVSIAPGQSRIETSLLVTRPYLWWPWDQGFPSLYRLTATLIDGSGRVCNTLSQTFGFRSVKLERSRERFVYLINERPVFLRGTSYMPGLYLSECNASSLSRDLSFVRDLNLNLLRVHVHVSPPLLYDLCDRAGIMIWQDFELNWVHDTSPDFERRALALQRDMIDLLGDHPSIITWACHNEPTMLFSRRKNLEQRPDPALYADACTQDPARPVFLCSGQLESDWRRSGDVHSYYGAIWTADYTDVYAHPCRLNTEFGFEAPAARATLQRYPEAWERLKHLDVQIGELWDYQAQLIQFHVENFRRQREQTCGGYIHFWFADLAPQVGCGVLDMCRQPKGGYRALQQASQPLHIAMEHDGHRPYALWIFNDTLHEYAGALAICHIYDAQNVLHFEACIPVNIGANRSQRIQDADWPVPPQDCDHIELQICGGNGVTLARNSYHHPFRPMPRPRGYPWKFDPFLGCKVFDLAGAPSLADQSGNPILKIVPLSVRQRIAEWVLRQRLSPKLASTIAAVVDLLNR